MRSAAPAFPPETTARYLRLAVALLDRGVDELGRAIAADALVPVERTLAQVAKNVDFQVATEEPALDPGPRGFRVFLASIERGDFDGSVDASPFDVGSVARQFATALRKGDTPATSPVADWLARWVSLSLAQLAHEVETAGDGYFVAMPYPVVSRALDVVRLSHALAFASHGRGTVIKAASTPAGEVFLSTLRRAGWVEAMASGKAAADRAEAAEREEAERARVVAEGKAQLVAEMAARWGTDLSRELDDWKARARRLALSWGDVIRDVEAEVERMKDARPELTPAPAAEHTEARLAVGVLVRHGEFLLLGKRKVADGLGTWSTPGGFIKPGETTAQAAKRELAEETGIEVDLAAIRVLNFCTFAKAEPEHEPPLGAVTLFWAVVDFDRKAVVEAEVREPEKCAEWRWREEGAWPDPVSRGTASLIAAVGPISPWADVERLDGALRTLEGKHKGGAAS